MLVVISEQLLRKNSKIIVKETTKALKWYTTKYELNTKTAVMEKQRNKKDKQHI